MQISLVNAPAAANPNAHYPCNRPPLAGSPMVKLLLGRAAPEIEFSASKPVSLGCARLRVTCLPVVSVSVPAPYGRADQGKR